MNADVTRPGGAASAGLRQAALLLHGVGNDDREWLLGELAAGQRSLLESLLGELHALGVPPSPELIDALLATGTVATQPRATPVGAPASTEPLAQQLAQLAPSALAEVLRDEPDALVARALRSGHGSWARPVLKQLGVSQRRRIEDLHRTIGPATDAAVGRRLDDALLQALMVQAARRSAASGTDRSATARLADSIRRMTRRAGEDSLSSKGRP